MPQIIRIIKPEIPQSFLEGGTQILNQLATDNFKYNFKISLYLKNYLHKYDSKFKLQNIPYK